MAAAFALLDGYVAEGVVPGAAAVVIYRGQVVGEHYTGLAGARDGRPVEAGTIFALASLTKPVTATTLLVLVERGLCSLDEPVERFIPELREVAGGGAVRVRHLLTHTSGLPGYVPEDGALRAAQAPLGAFLAAALRCAPSFPAGSALRYSNPGVHLQAALIERLSGQGYHAAVRDLVLAPLALRDSFIPLPEEQRARVAHVADPGYPGTPHEQFNSPYFRGLGIPWGGLYATARDVSRFLGYFLAAWPDGDAAADAPDGPLSRTTRRAMTSIAVAVPPAPPHPADDLNAQEWPLVEWGLGWEVKGGKRPHRTGELTSARTFTHAGASGTMMWADPASGLACVLLANRALASGWAAAPARQARFSNAVAAALRV
jgi:CubicO group peptidase (beta-lactamase class C family)